MTSRISLPRAGTVREVFLVQDKMTGKSRGFAFVTMATEQEAQNAAKQLNGKEFHGRTLTVNEARPREDFAGTGGARNKSFKGGETAVGDPAGSKDLAQARFCLATAARHVLQQLKIHSLII